MLDSIKNRISFWLQKESFLYPIVIFLILTDWLTFLLVPGVVMAFVSGAWAVIISVILMVYLAYRIVIECMNLLRYPIASSSRLTTNTGFVGYREHCEKIKKINKEKRKIEYEDFVERQNENKD